MLRNSLSVHATTSIDQNLLTDYEEKVARFCHFVKNKTTGLYSKYIGNMDEFTVSFEKHRNHSQLTWETRYFLLQLQENT